MLKKIKLLLVFLLSMTSLSALAPVASAQDKVTVTFWHAMNGPHQEALAALVQKFNESQDKVVVEEQNQGNYKELQQKIMASAASGTLPTMTQLTASAMAEFKDAELIAPLDELLVADNGFTDELKGDIYEGFLKGTTIDGKLYALPFAKAVRIMFVNQDLLTKIGKETPKTWEDIKALGEAMKAAGVEGYALGLENSLSMEVETMARQNGADWVSADLKSVDLSSDKATEPVQFIKSLLVDGYARTAGEDKYMSGPFSQGQVAVYLGSSAGLPHVLPGIKENNITMTTEELPIFGGGQPLTLFAGNDLGVFDGVSAEEQAAAVQFMSFLLQPENTAEWAQKTGYLPVTKRGVETDAWKKYLEENPYAVAPTKELSYGQAQPVYKGSGKVFGETDAALENIMINDADIKATMEAVQEMIKANLGL